MLPLTVLSRSEQQPPPSPPLLHNLIEDILSRLPVKPLMRFKCVSKSWNSLISDKNFAKLHLRRSPKNVDLILTLQPELPEDFDYYEPCIVPYALQSFIQDPSSAFSRTLPEGTDGSYSLDSEFWGDSCNGLVCLHGSLKAEDYETSEYWFRLWNPAIRFKSEKSPSLHVKLNDWFHFDFGFGYDESSDTYKVVAIVCDRIATEDPPVVKLYSAGDTCWRNIQSFPAFPITVRNKGQFVCGALNWLAVRNMSGEYKWKTVTINQLVIVSLDMATETYAQYLLPDGFDEIPLVSPALGVLRDCLCLFHDYKDTHFVVWQMTEFGAENTWTQFIRISYQPLQLPDQGFFFSMAQFYAVEPLCISEDGGVLMLGIDESDQVIRYGLRDHSVKAMRMPFYRGCIKAKDYVSSLIMP